MSPSSHAPKFPITHSAPNLPVNVSADSNGSAKSYKMITTIGRTSRMHNEPGVPETQSTHAIIVLPTLNILKRTGNNKEYIVALSTNLMLQRSTCRRCHSSHMEYQPVFMKSDMFRTESIAKQTRGLLRSLLSAPPVLAKQTLAKIGRDGQFTYSALSLPQSKLPNICVASTSTVPQRWQQPAPQLQMK